MLFQNREVAATAQILVSRKRNLELRNLVLGKGRYVCAEEYEHFWGITHPVMRKAVAPALLG